jgi:hypothetical protein
MNSIKHHVEYLADARAVRLVEAREAVRAARTRLTQSRLLNEVEPSRENRAFLEEAEFACVQAERRALALQKTTEAKRFD